MIVQTSNPPDFDQIAWRIKVQVPIVLKMWGLVPRFKRWRLSRDPNTGMVVLFGVLNNRYIARHTSIPFSNYFDPRLLHDLANKLLVQVVSGNSDGLRYAFILSQGRYALLPTQNAVPFLDENIFPPAFIRDWSVFEVVEESVRLAYPYTSVIFADDLPRTRIYQRADEA
jgi:hypothetical protein